MTKLQPVRGTRDVLGEDARRHAHVVARFAAIAARYGFSEIATPIFEFTEVFKRTLGETSDVVSKEMYSFADRGGDEITLRPEYTAGIARAFISGGMQQNLPCRFWAHGPMFRYERPQKGRFRQFHQIDAEVLGLDDAENDVELIALAYDLLTDLGLADKTVLHLNTLGDPESREAYRDALVAYFSAHEAELSEDSRARLKRNPLRILDSKDEGDRALIPNAPAMADYLNDASRDFFARVTGGLETLGIAYTHDQALVRGLDYYCHTAFEFITDALGAQGTVIGGGRYDGLIAAMGGPPTPGSGWAGGIERLAMLIDSPAAPRSIILMPMGAAAEQQSLKLAHDLRRAGLTLIVDRKANLKKRMARANRDNAAAALILGEDELAAGAVTLRDLDSGEQTAVALDRLQEALQPYR